MGANVQVCWEKFCRYWDVELRSVPDGERATHLTADGAAVACDENTIGVVAILGSTFDGSYEPVEAIAAALDDLQADTGLDVPCTSTPPPAGSSRRSSTRTWSGTSACRACSRSTPPATSTAWSTPGSAGWSGATGRRFREELVFDVNYLGGQMPTFALNFSRPGAQVVAQYYKLIRLGREGYRRVQQAARDTALWLSGEIAKLEPFRLISDGGELPVFAFALRPEVARLHGLRRLGGAARARLDRAGLPDAARDRRPVGPAGLRPQRLLARPRVDAARRHPATPSTASTAAPDLRRPRSRTGRRSTTEAGGRDGSSSFGCSRPGRLMRTASGRD